MYNDTVTMKVYRHIAYCRLNAGPTSFRLRELFPRNYANEDEKDYNEDVFTVELIEHADVYRAVDEPSTDDDDDFASLHEEDEWEMVSHELVHYAETTDLDQCNNVHVPTHQEGIMDNGATAHMTGDLALLHWIVPCKRGVRLADDHALPTLQSISRITQHSDEAVLNFKHDYCAVNVKDHLSIVAKWNDAYLYSMRSELILPGDDDEVNTAEKLGAGLWHARMGHIPAVTMTAVGKATTGEPKQVLKQSHARTA
ncbi:hypothetical protein DYB36_009872 [Aphanomyces astaci]|uniref:GAG-pre-integrase domain-containing protein n=1 Tax=Aphanomyces astaci TaxID=112090 RepID=A0A397AN64_APHAT|nr:hypothetical protein DYB36_009872 [Aphanomyces astaci]